MFLVLFYKLKLGIAGEYKLKIAKTFLYKKVKLVVYYKFTYVQCVKTSEKKCFH